MEQKRCISSLTLAELTAALKAMGQPGFRAKQIFHWVHQKLVTEFSALTDQPRRGVIRIMEQNTWVKKEIAVSQKASTTSSASTTRRSPSPTTRHTARATSTSR